jgi:hypothetical protein
MMKVAALLALLLAGCTASPAATAPPTAPVASAPSASPTPVLTTPEPSASPSPTVVVSTVYTADDDEIAKLIRAGAAEAIPDLKGLNDMDPSKLEGQFLPLGDWITGQRAGLAAFSATTCTASAVELFNDGLDQYDAIRKQFLAWRDWGAQGHAFPVAAPGQAVIAFEKAVVELDAQCRA